MRTVTAEEVMLWLEYDRACVESLFAGRKSLMAGGVVTLDIPAVHRLLVLNRMMPDDRARRLFAADVAEAALLGVAWWEGAAVDERSLAAVDVARRHARGEASAAELVAACVAAWSAYGVAEAASVVFGAAARSAAWAAGDTAGAAAAKSAVWADWSVTAAAWSASAARSVSAAESASAARSASAAVWSVQLDLAARYVNGELCSDASCAS